MSPYREAQLEGFIAELASAAPVPGGGSVAALLGALGAALFAMVAEITMTKKKPEDKTPIAEALAKLIPIRNRFLELMDEDAQAFSAVMDAFKMPKETEAQQAARKEAVARATFRAAEVPQETANLALTALAAGRPLAELGAASAISDVACGALCLEAAARAAAYNIAINLSGINDERERVKLSSALRDITGALAELEVVRTTAEERLRGT